MVCEKERTMTSAVEKAFACCIEHDELVRELGAVVGEFYALRLDGIAKEISWHGMPWNRVLGDMLDDAILGMDGKSIIRKYAKIAHPCFEPIGGCDD